MKSIGVLPALRKGKHKGPDGPSARAAVGSGLCVFALAVLCSVIFPAAALAAGGIEMGAGREATIGTDPATGDRVMGTPPPVPQQQDQGPQTVIVAPEVDLRRPGYGPTPPRPYPPGPRPYGPPAPGAPYPGRR